MHNIHTQTGKIQPVQAFIVWQFKKIISKTFLSQIQVQQILNKGWFSLSRLFKLKTIYHTETWPEIRQVLPTQQLSLLDEVFIGKVTAKD